MSQRCRVVLNRGHVPGNVDDHVIVEVQPVAGPVVVVDLYQVGVVVVVALLQDIWPNETVELKSGQRK